MEKRFTDLKDYGEFLENNNKILFEEIASIKSESLQLDKCYSCDLLKKWSNLFAWNLRDMKLRERYVKYSLQK